MKKTALFINFNLRPGGAERRFARLISHNNGKHAKLIINRDGDKLLSENGVTINDNHKIIIKGGNKSLPQKIISAFYLWHAIFTLKIRHVHYPIDPSIFTLIHAALSKTTRTTYSISVVDSSRTHRRDFSSLQYLIWRTSLTRATRVDFLSSGIKDNIKNIFKIEPTHQISPTSFTDYSKAHYSAQKLYDVVVLSRLVKGKGIELFFDSLDVIRKSPEHKNIGTIGIFGDGPLRELVKSKIKEYVEFNFEFGYAHSPFDILSKTRVFMSLQEHENYPSQAVLEALASGACVIATDVGETQKIVPDGIGHRVKPTPEDTAKQIIESVNNHKLGHFDPKIPMDFVRSKFSVESYANYFNEFLSNAANKE